jgi:hypothetical protein
VFITFLQYFGLNILNLGHRLILAKEFDSAPVQPPAPYDHLLRSFTYGLVILSMDLILCMHVMNIVKFE